MQLEEEIVQSVLDESVLNLPRQERYSYFIIFGNV